MDNEAFMKNLARQAQEAFAPALNEITWTLLKKNKRSTEDNDQMLMAAFASAYHYLESGTPADQQRAQWLISRVYCALGNGREALAHASRCLTLTEKHSDVIADYDKAFALESVARASALAGDSQEAAKYHKLAAQAGEKIEDEDARKVFLDEFLAGDWAGIA